MTETEELLAKIRAVCSKCEHFTRPGGCSTICESVVGYFAQLDEIDERRKE